MNEIKTPLDRLLEWSNEAEEVPTPTRRLGRQHDVARELGVSDKRVATWRTRSARNGFPDPVACWWGQKWAGRPGNQYLWDLDEVSAWFSTYDVTAQRGRRGPYWDTEEAVS